MRAFVECRVKPYYLHHGDLAPGTGHFRTTIAEGQALMRALRGRYSGLCQPTYVLDIPGGHGKAPIGPAYSRRGLGRGLAGWAARLPRVAKIEFRRHVRLQCSINRDSHVGGPVAGPRPAVFHEVFRTWPDPRSP